LILGDKRPPPDFVRRCCVPYRWRRGGRRGVPLRALARVHAVVAQRGRVVPHHVEYQRRALSLPVFGVAMCWAKSRDRRGWAGFACGAWRVHREVGVPRGGRGLGARSTLLRAVPEARVGAARQIKVCCHSRVVGPRNHLVRSGNCSGGGAPRPAISPASPARTRRVT